MLDNHTIKELSNGKKMLFTFLITDKKGLSTNGHKVWQCIAESLQSAYVNLHQNIDVDEEEIQVFCDTEK